MLPEELGGTGWLGEDGTVEECADALQRRFGVGCYSQDRDSAHGLYCLAIATGLGIAKAEDWAILYNAYPDKATDLLTEWEDLLGLDIPPLDWTTEQRWERLLGRCREAKGNNPVVMAIAFSLLVGETCYVSETDYVVAAPHDDYARFQLAVILPEWVWGTTLWSECERLRDRLQPAHCYVYLCVTKIAAGATYRPIFRSDESLLDRDCTRPHYV